MKFTLNWLKEYLDTNASLEEISARLTAIGLEVENIEDPAKALQGFVVGHVLSAERHPDADKLQCLVVDTGKEKLKVVCGAPNARSGMKGVFAPAGSYIPGSDITLKKSVIRGQESNGMMCSERELLLSGEHAGIIDLPETCVTGSPAAEALGVDDSAIEINLTPNRGDCAGILGIARDLAAAGLGKIVPLRIDPAKEKFKNPVHVTIHDKKACPQFLGRYVRGVENGPSPACLQRKIKAVGLRPISKLVDITNYFTIALNRPLHIFDADKLKGNIHVRLSKKGETLAALNDKTYELDEGMIVVCDEGIEGGRVIGLGGVIGGTATAVDENTKNAYIECAYFDPTLVAKIGQKLQIDSDARYRFERGIDPAFTAQGMEHATQMLLNLCGGEASDVAAAGESPKITRDISYTPERLKLLGGMDLPEARQKEILSALGFTVESGGRAWNVKTPSWRHDVEGSADIVEEILRIEGYDNIPTVYVRPAPAEKRRPMNILSKRSIAIRRVLAARGLNETITWSFMASGLADLFGARLHQNKKALTLTNPISLEMSVMRPSILPNLVEAAAKNADRGYPDACFFEVGNIYRATTAEGQIMTAAGLRSGNALSRHWSGAPRAVDAFDAKADAFAVLEASGVNLANVQISRDAPDWYHPGRSGVLRLGPATLGYFGELNPAVLEAMKREETYAGFEVFLSALPQTKRKSPQRPLLKPSPFQPLRRDFAFIVDEMQETEKLVRAIKGAEKSLIAAIDIFDVYQGKGVEQGRKSVALGVTIQPVERTLTDEEINALSAKIIDAAQKQAGAVLRG